MYPSIAATTVACALILGVGADDGEVFGTGCYNPTVNMCTNTFCSQSACEANKGFVWIDASCETAMFGCCRGSDGVCDILGNPPEDSASDDGGGPSCFSSETFVETLDGPVKMKHLKVGEAVLTAKGNYELVYAFAHRHETTPKVFLKFEFAETNDSLEITTDHFVMSNKGTRKQAGSVQVGDYLVSQGSRKEVIGISKVNRKGIYAPLTYDGTVVVSGVGASCYAAVSTQSDNAAISYHGYDIPLIDQVSGIHMTLSPLRILSRLGLLSEGSYDEEGYHPFVAVGVKAVRWTESQSLPIYVAAFAAWMACAGFVGAFEIALFPFGTLLIQIISVAWLGLLFSKKMHSRKAKLL